MWLLIGLKRDESDTNKRQLIYFHSSQVYHIRSKLLLKNIIYV